jgi:hypothetical protein
MSYTLQPFDLANFLSPQSAGNPGLITNLLALFLSNSTFRLIFHTEIKEEKGCRSWQPFTGLAILVHPLVITFLRFVHFDTQSLPM